MNPLPAQLLNVYEERKPVIQPAFANAVHNPPQFYQTTASTIAGTHQGPLRTMTDGAGPSGAGGMGGVGEGSWLDNHGVPWWMAQPREIPSRLTPWSEEKLAQLQVRLQRKLGPEYIANRPGPGGGPKLTYIEGWKVINLANEVFGFNGWSSEIRSLHTDFLDTNASGRCSIAVTAHIRITLADGAYHEDIGHGSGENLKGKAAALEKAKKEAVTDAMKRALRYFGNVLGNCVYDKEFCKDVQKVRVVPIKFNPDELERRPEYAQPSRPVPPPAHVVMPNPNATAGPSRPPQQPQQRAQQQPPSAAAQARAQAAGINSDRIQREETPIRSIHDPDITVGDTTVATVQEHFDAEFMEEAGFFDDVDMSAMDGADGNEESAQAAPPLRGNGQQGVDENAAPAYQHRHRPEPATGPAPAPARTDTSSGPSRATSQEAGSGSGRGGPSRSSGSHFGGATGEKVGEGNENVGPLRSRGGFRDHNGLSGSGSAGNSATAAAARRQAISAALANEANNAAETSAGPSYRPAGPSVHNSAYTTPHRPLHAARTGPIRAESPNIPQGGIDTAAARAAERYAAAAAKLDLDVPGAERGMSIAGFSSARGIKRVSEDMGASPTKDRGQASAIPGQIRRSGPRQALGEISLDDAEDGTKRHRVM